MAESGRPDDVGGMPSARPFLHELFPVHRWLPDDESIPAQYRPGTNSSSSAEPTSYSSIPRRFLKNLTARLVRTLDGLVISTTIPPALVQLLPNVRPAWILEASPCGNFLAVLCDSRLEVRSRTANFEVTGVARLDRDGFPSWRRVAWSFDSQLLAVSASNGRVTVVRSDGAIMCVISPKSKGSGTGKGSTALPTQPVQVDLQALGEGKGNDSVGFIDPVSILLFLPPQRDSKDPELSFEGHPYTHELLVITYDGLLRSYLIHKDELGSSLPPPNTTSFVPAMHTRRASSPGLSMLRESKSHAGRITFYHKFSFDHWHECVCTATIDVERGIMLVSGKAVQKSKSMHSTSAATGPGSSVVSEWKLSWDKPYYHMEGLELSERVVSPHGSDEEDDERGVWGGLRKALSVNSVLMSLQPSRRRLYLDTIHQIALSPNGKRLVTLDCGGTLKLWDALRLDLVCEWTTSALRKKLGLPFSESADIAKQVTEQGPATTVPDILTSMGWWSDSSVFLSFGDGYVRVVAIPSLMGLLVADVPPFPKMPDAVALQPDRIFILMHETEVVRLRFRDGIYTPIRTVVGDYDTEGPTSGALISRDKARSILEIIVSLLSRPLRIFTSTILWHWEEDASPSQKTVIVNRRHYQLMCLLKTTPLEAMRRKIHGQEYEAALQLAHEHGLDIDEVYKAQWMRADVTENAIADYLAKIKDREWALRSCVERVPATSKAARLLLRYGLTQTDVISLQDVEREVEELLDEIDEEAVHHARVGVNMFGASTATICTYRARILKYLDRLETHAAIFAGSFDEEDADGQRITFAEHFAWFRDCNLVLQAVDFAVDEDTVALEHLFTRHGKDILPYRLAVLDHIPETADPTDYKHLLPRIEPATQREIEWQVIPWRRPDWTESDSVREFLEMVEDEEEGESNMNSIATTLRNSTTLPPEIICTVYPAPQQVLSEWYASRARFMEAASGQSDLALDLVRLGIQHHVSGLEDLRDNLITLGKLLYECYDPTSKDVVDLSLDRLSRLSPEEVLRLFVAQSTDETIVRDVKRFVLPYICNRAIRADPSLKATRPGDEYGFQKQSSLTASNLQILYGWIASVAEEHLEWCTLILEDSVAAGSEEERIVSADKLPELVLECAYRCHRSDAAVGALYDRLRHCLPVEESEEETKGGRRQDGGKPGAAKAQRGSSSTRKPKPSSWEDELDITLDDVASTAAGTPKGLKGLDPELQARVRRFIVHVKVAQILAEYGLPKPLPWLKDAETHPEQQRALLLLLARQSSGDRAAPAGSVIPADESRFDDDEDWMGLLTHMLSLHEMGVLSLVPRKDIYVEYLSVILSCGLFKLAKRIMHPDRKLPPLSADAMEGLLINAAKEYYDNADSGDMTQGLMRKARECLNVLPSSPALQTELDFVQATHQLTVRYNLTSENTGDIILPIQIRLHPDRVQLIARLLYSEPDAYRAPLDDLTRKILREQYSATAKARVHALIADAALRAGDCDFAYKTCEALLIFMDDLHPYSRDVANAVCEVCMGLAGVASWREVEKKMKLVGHALTLCTEEKMTEVLGVWTRLETERVALSAVRSAMTHGEGENTEEDALSLVANRSAGDGAYVFSHEKALGELERQALAFDDPVFAASEGQRLSQSSFYSTEPNIIIKGKRKSEKTSSARRIVLEALMRLKSVQTFNDDHENRPASNDRKTDDSQYDAELLSLAREWYATDATYALGYMLAIKEDTTAKRFFEELPASPVNEQLACYYFAVRALHIALGEEDRAELINELYRCDPADILSRVREISAKYGVDESQPPESENSGWDLHLDEHTTVADFKALSQNTATSPHVKTLLATALRHATSMATKSQAQKLRSLYDMPGVDIARFEADPAYRREAVLNLARTVDIAVLERAFVLAKHVSIDDYDVAIEALEWWFASEAAGDVQALIEKVKPIVQRSEKMQDTVDRIGQWHAKISGTSRTKLLQLYKFLVDCAESTQTHLETVPQVSLRIDVLQRLAAGGKALSIVDFKELISSQSADVDTFINAFGPIRSIPILEVVAAIVPSVLQLSPIALFADEVDVVDLPKAVVAAPGIVSKLHAHYLDSKLPSVPWEYLEEQSVAAQLSQFMILFEHLSAEDLLQITRTLTVAESAIGIPVIYRQDLVSKSDALMQQHAAAGKVSEAHLNEIRSIKRHLNLIGGLASLVDNDYGETIAPERVQQFDALYGKETNQFAGVVMRMVIGGISPVLVYQACKLLSAAFDQDLTILYPATLYKETAWSILGVPSATPFEGVFRRGVDSPLAAFERVLGSVAPYAPAPAAEIGSPQATAEGGWHVHGNDDFRDTTSPSTSTSTAPTKVNEGWDDWEEDHSAKPKLSPRPSLTVDTSRTHPAPQHPSQTDIDSEGWDIGHIEGLSPVKTKPAAPVEPLTMDSGWDIDLQGLSPVKESKPDVESSESGWDIDHIPGLSPVKETTKPAEGLGDSGWDIDYLEGLSPVKQTSHEPSGNPGLNSALSDDKEQVSAIDSGWDIDLSGLNPVKSSPLSGNTVPAPTPGPLGGGQEGTVTPHTPSKPAPGLEDVVPPSKAQTAGDVLSEPFDVIMVNIMKALRECLTTVVNDQQRFGPALGMQMLDLLKRYFILSATESIVMQRRRLCLMAAAAWNVQIRESDLIDISGRQKVLQTLLASTQTAAQAQALVAVLSEWLPPIGASNTQQAGVRGYPVPAYLQLYWNALLCWMVEHQEFSMALLVRVEFAAFNILDQKGEMILLQTLQDSQKYAEYFKHGLLSRHARIRNEAISELHSVMDTAPSPMTNTRNSSTSQLQGPFSEVEQDRFLHVLICARGLAALVAGTPLWPAVRASLLASAPDVNPTNQFDGYNTNTRPTTNHSRLLTTVAGELRGAGYVAAAASLLSASPSASGSRSPIASRPSSSLGLVTSPASGAADGGGGVFGRVLNLAVAAAGAVAHPLLSGHVTRAPIPAQEWELEEKMLERVAPA
ncbi:secretory pathway protein Sec39-domain-containing protein [Fimicolochytrium jonesii]|uniref:secretory pathway protein Sec39-domain-containing protein n=1 Tax=Fimicolochytrium jonesii TaxID=1396493 RepID=UPI0022FE8DEA|nr:secretory pathway protein Sec39-domain-containing protein [Fimicolochytrium jonesii]KAI8815835.1 secretory pathway protein Sec39-domain-containing protein [Fimicolochytrium jonesii]